MTQSDVQLLCSAGTRSVSVVTLWKETSVLCLFRPSFCPGAARRCCLLVCLCVFCHSGFFRSLPAFSPTAFSFETLLYLTDIFRRRRQRGLHFSTLVFSRSQQNCSDGSLAFSSSLLSVFLVTEAAGSFYCKLGTFVQGDAQSGACGRTDSRDVCRLNSVFRIATQTNAIINAK